jgi:hypothetical protein
MPDIMDGAAPGGATPNATPADSGSTPNQGAGGEGSKVVNFDPERHIEKSEFTKMRQRDKAEMEKAIAAAVRQREEGLSQKEQQLTQVAQILMQRMAAQQGGQANDPFGKLRELPYIGGNDLIEVVEQIRNRDIGGLAQEIRKRDQALQLIYGQLQKLQKASEEVRGRHVETEFSERLRKVRDSLELPDAPWANEFLKDVYLSHEGEGLAEEFPDLAKTRLTELRKAFRELDKATAEKARQTAIPGKGGLATPSKKLNEGAKTAAQLADELWPLIQDDGGQ